MKTLNRPFLAALAFVSLGAATKAHAGMVIIPTFDASVTSGQQAVIQQALNFYNNTFANNVTIQIEFVTGGSGGSSGANPTAISYTTVKNALGTVASTFSSSVLTNALSFWNVGNITTSLELTSADCRAIGLGCAANQAGTGSFASSTFDGVVTVASNLYADTSVIDHEINEVLGVGGWGTILTSSVNGGSALGAILDPYRFSAPGTKSFTNATTATSYFSLNGGTTNIASFNQTGIGDYGDLTTSPCYAQSYTVCASPLAVSLTSPEGLMLQGAGYVPPSSGGATPEPASFSLMGIALAGLAIIRRRK